MCEKEFDILEKELSNKVKNKEYTRDQLILILKKYNLSTTGNKNDLVKHYMDCFGDEDEFKLISDDKPFDPFKYQEIEPKYTIYLTDVNGAINPLHISTVFTQIWLKNNNTKQPFWMKIIQPPWINIVTKHKLTKRTIDNLKRFLINGNQI